MADYTNYCSDPEILREVEDDLNVTKQEGASGESRLMVIRRDRDILRDRWLRYHAIWAAERDQQSYQGRSKSYLAIGRKIIESWVGKLKRDLFAGDPWFLVKADSQEYEEQANSVQALFEFFLKKHMQVRRKSGPLLRQLVTYGTSPVFMGWRKDERTGPVMRNIMQDGITRTTQRDEKILDYIGPTFRIVDLFAWYVWPTTVMDLDDAEFVFEDQLTTLARLKALSEIPIERDDPEGGMLIDPDQLAKVIEQRGSKKDVSSKEKFQAEASRLKRKGFTHRLDDEDDRARPIDTTLLYRYRAFGDDPEPRWWEIVVACDNTPLRIRPNPWWDDKVPWLAPKFVEVTNEYYGWGLPACFDRLQYWITDVMDQASDGLTYSMNPIAVVDQFKVQDPTSIRFRAGAKWLADPSGVVFTEPSKETPAIGMNAIQTGIALMNDVSNNFPTAGSPAGRANRGRALSTATGASILLSESMIEIRDVIENVEDMLWNPGLARMHSRTQQHFTQKLLLQVRGKDGVALVQKKLSVADVVGDYTMTWLGSLSALDRPVRSQQMVNMLQIVSQVPPEVLQTQNVEVDWVFLLRTLWGGQGFGLRDGERVFKTRVQTKTIDAEIENDLFSVGRGAEVMVSPADNDHEHAMKHLAALKMNASWAEETKQQMVQHIQAHIASFHAKQAMQAQQELARGLVPGLNNAQPSMLDGGPMNANGAGGGPSLNGQGANDGSGMPRGRLGQTTTSADVMRQAPRGFS